MRHFPLPIHAAVVAASVVAGLASYQGVDKLVLARGGSQYETASEPGHEPSSSTSTTVHRHETGSTTSTTSKQEPAPSTSSTAPKDPGATTSTTLKHEPGTTPPPTTPKTPEPPSSTTVPNDPTPPTTTAPAPTGVEALTLRCGTVVLPDGRAGASCAWSQSTAPNFFEYVVTRELVGTPAQPAFTTQDRTHNHFGDTTLVPGNQYSYIVWAYDAAGNVVGRSAALHVNCCDGKVVST